MRFFIIHNLAIYTKIWERRTRELEAHIIKGSTRCELISAGFDAVSESAILWIMSADNINELRTDDTRKKNIELCKREKDWSPSYLKLGMLSFIPKIVISRT